MDMKEIQDVVKRTLDAVHNLDSISDEDLEITIKNIKPMITMLGRLGDKFYLTWKALFEDLNTLEGFKRERENS